MKQISDKIIRSVLFGVCVFALHFVLIPLVCRAWPDFIWIGLMIIIPLAATWIFYRKCTILSASAILPAFLIQYLLLILLADPVSKLWGCSVSRVLGWPEYIGSTFAWPVATAVIQAITLFEIKKSNK